MSTNKERFARFGIGTKGFVYILIGGLTAAAAFGRGQKTDSSRALEFLSNQPLGLVLIGITVLGLCGLVFWRFYQAFKDPEDKGNDFKGIANRIGYFSSGFFYCFLIVSGVEILLNSNSGSGNSKETLVAKLLDETYGQIMVIAISLIFLGKAIYQFWRAFSGKFKDKVKATGHKIATRKFILYTGRIGYTARGIVISIIAYLTFSAALHYDSNKAGGTEEAFHFVQNEFGTFILFLIAAGLLSYGIFMLIKARYRKMVI